MPKLRYKHIKIRERVKMLNKATGRWVYKYVDAKSQNETATETSNQAKALNKIKCETTGGVVDSSAETERQKEKAAPVPLSSQLPACTDQRLAPQCQSPTNPNVKVVKSEMAATTNPVPDSKSLLRPYDDPAMLHLLEVLEVAKKSQASPEVIQGIQKVLHYVDLRDQFTLDSSSMDSPTCRKVTQDTMTEDWAGLHQKGLTSWNLTPRMLSGRLEGQFLKSILSAQRAKRVLEVGMYTGYSALSMAEALPADGELVTLDKEPYLQERNRPVMDSVPHGKKISIKIGNALELMRDMVKEGKKFDFIFLDAQKSEYIDYLKLCIDGGLLAENGTVAVDNAYMHGRNYFPSDQPPDASRLFSQHVRDDSRLHKVLVPVRDGVLLIRRLSEVEPDLPH